MWKIVQELEDWSIFAKVVDKIPNRSIPKNVRGRFSWPQRLGTDLKMCTLIFSRDSDGFRSLNLQNRPIQSRDPTTRHDLNPKIAFFGLRFLEKHNHDFLSWSKCHIFLRSPLVRDHFGTLFGSRLSSVAELRQKIKMADFAFFSIFETKNCSGAELRQAEKEISKPKTLPRKCRLCCQQKV